MTYAQARNLLIAFLLAYAASGFTIHFFTDDIEDAYPLFSWSLFAKVPNRLQTSFEAYIVAVHGEQIEPVPLESRPDTYQADTQPGQIRSLVQRVGIAIAEKDERRAAAEARILAEKLVVPATIEIRSEVVDVLEHYTTGAIKESTALTQFSVQ